LEDTAIARPFLKSTAERLSRERGHTVSDPGGRLRVCLVYPNTYSVGMSNLGFQSLYGLLNAGKDRLAERVFLPDKADMAELRAKAKYIESFETSTPLKDFDVIAFSVSFEDDYINIPRILSLASIPVFSKDREGRGPLIMAGGCAVTLNPEPIADFMDFFFIGEAEGVMDSLVGKLSEVIYGGATKKDALKALSKTEGIYVPSLYNVTYDGVRVKSIEPADGAPLPVRRVRASGDSLDIVPSTIVFTPDTEFSDTALIEVERGCQRGCRFCAAGFVYLPPRERSLEAVIKAIDEASKTTTKIGLVGAAVSEYTGIKEVLRHGASKGLTMTLSSLRADMLDDEFLELLGKSGYRTLTIAPEAASDRLRRVINKCITDKQLLTAASMAASRGFSKLKLYFMVGLPTETDEDVSSIVGVTQNLAAAFKGSIALSVGAFVPKPFTPFQWHRFESEDVIERRYKIIEDGLAHLRGRVEVKTHPVRAAFTQAYLAMADRRASKAVLEASRSGWKPAFSRAMPKVEPSVWRERQKDEVFAFDIIDQGISKEYLYNEYTRSIDEKTTEPCEVGSCSRCGVC